MLQLKKSSNLCSVRVSFPNPSDVVNLDASLKPNMCHWSDNLNLEHLVVLAPVPLQRFSFLERLQKPWPRRHAGNAAVGPDNLNLEQPAVLAPVVP